MTGVILESVGGGGCCIVGSMVKVRNHEGDRGGDWEVTLVDEVS